MVNHAIMGIDVFKQTPDVMITACYTISQGMIMGIM